MKVTLPFIFEKLKKDFALRRREIKFLLFFLSLFISFFLFYIMSVLISSGKNLYGKSDKDANIYFLINESIDELELRDRRRPKKPKQEEIPPETPKIKVQQTEIQKPEMSSSLPDLELPTDFNVDGVLGVGQGMSQNTEVTPIFRINPSYPRQAALKQIEGFVILQFDITESGETDNISILQASPPQIFNSSSIQALKRWKYKPKMEEGKPVRQNDIKVQLDFKLSQD